MGCRAIAMASRSPKHRATVDGIICHDNAHECLCENNPGVRTGSFDICCDKGDGKGVVCHSNDSGCL